MERASKINSTVIAFLIPNKSIHSFLESSKAFYISGVFFSSDDGKEIVGFLLFCEPPLEAIARG